MEGCTAPPASKKRCVDWEVLPDDRVSEMAASSFPLWTVQRDEALSCNKLVRKFVCKNFVAAMDFLQKTGEAAEVQGHHPDLHLTNFNNVEVVVYSHSLRGVTENDFILCGNIDAIKVTYSKKFLDANPACQVNSK